MDTHADFAAQFERWAHAGGPRRAALLAPLRRTLTFEPPVPDDYLDALGPALWVLEQARDGLALNADGMIERSLALGACGRFGWKPEGIADGAFAASEIEVLFVLLCREGFIERRDGSAHHGSDTHLRLAHPEVLWMALAGSLIDPSAHGPLEEFLLASVLLDRRDSERRRLLRKAVLEASGLTHPIRVFEALPVLDLAGECSGYLATLGRALRMFESRSADAAWEQGYTDGGRAMAIRALRSIVASGRYATMLPVMAGAN
ncbi:MAG: hypothetical protein ACRDKZ_11825 [Actinomycetota bacterium]